MNIVRTVSALRTALAGPRTSGLLGFVPTMGALHRGHAALIEQARAECAHVVVSVFVNPRQFNDPADLAAYPRREGEDTALARAAGAETVFIPGADQVFPSTQATWVSVGGDALGFEADHRPGHFDAVALVCLKLFGMVEPHRAYFGQKDAQQVAVIRQLVRDFDLNLEVRVCPTVRDPDGLALSSRNERLSTTERTQALVLPRALVAGLEAHRGGRDPVLAAREALGPINAEYVAVATFSGEPTLVIAARVGRTRLIDNVPLDRPEAAGLAVQV
jgi:pantoate--beta-alanine ligase